MGCGSVGESVTTSDISRGGGNGASENGRKIVGKDVGTSDGCSVSRLGEIVGGGVGSADPTPLGLAVVCCLMDGAPVPVVGKVVGRIGDVGVNVGVPVGLVVAVGLSVEGAPVGRTEGAPLEGGAEGPTVGGADGISVGIDEEGGQVGAKQATVSLVVQSTRLDTPDVACATIRTRVVEPAARLIADVCAQLMPEEHEPAHSTR